MNEGKTPYTGPVVLFLTDDDLRIILVNLNVTESDLRRRIQEYLDSPLRELFSKPF